MVEQAKKTDKVAAALWGAIGVKTLLAGTAFWMFVASQVVLAGPAALAVFGAVATSSAVGVGSMVGYCVKQAQANMAT